VHRALQHKVSLRFLLPSVLSALAPEAYRWIKPQYKEKLNPADYAKEGLGVQELVTEVKTELQRTDDARRQRGEAALFEVKSFDLEINFVVHKHVTEKGEVSYHLVTVSAEAQTGFDWTQKINLAAPPEPIRGIATPSGHNWGTTRGDSLVANRRQNKALWCSVV